MKLTSFKIHLDHCNQKFVSDTQTGKNALSEIYFSCNDFFFPRKGWLDFPIIVLSWWIDDFFLQKSELFINSTFMNGPYEFSLSRDEKNVKISFFENKVNDESLCLSSFYITQKNYARELILTAEAITDRLKGHSISNPDFNRLSERLRQAKLTNIS